MADEQNQSQNQPENNNSNKYQGDLVSAAVGTAVGTAIAGAGVGVGAAATVAAATAVATAVAGVVGVKSRYVIIGGLSALIISGVSLLNYNMGYNASIEKNIRGFNTETDRGVLIERGNGTRQAYTTTNGLDYVVVDENYMSGGINKAKAKIAEVKTERKSRIDSMYKQGETQ